METKKIASTILFCIISSIIISLFIFTDKATTETTPNGNIRIVNDNIIIYIDNNNDILNAKFVRYIVCSNKVYLYCFPFPSLLKYYSMNILKIEKTQKKNKFLWW